MTKFATGTRRSRATSIVVAYNPKSEYARECRRSRRQEADLTALFPLLETPGLKLGRTDPNVDRRAGTFIFMLRMAQVDCRLPADTVAEILGTSDFGLPDARRSSPSPLSSATLKPGHWTPPARQVTQAVGCTWPTWSCRTRST